MASFSDLSRFVLLSYVCWKYQIEDLRIIDPVYIVKGDNDWTSQYQIWTIFQLLFSF